MSTVLTAAGHSNHRLERSQGSPSANADAEDARGREKKWALVTTVRARSRSVRAAQFGYVDRKQSGVIIHCSLLIHLVLQMTSALSSCRPTTEWTYSTHVWTTLQAWILVSLASKYSQRHKRRSVSHIFLDIGCRFPLVETISSPTRDLSPWLPFASVVYSSSFYPYFQLSSCCAQLPSSHVSWLPFYPTACPPLPLGRMSPSRRPRRTGRKR